MTTQEKKIIDNVVKINVNYKNVNFSNLEKENTTFIYTDWDIRIHDIKDGEDSWKTISKLYESHKDDFEKQDCAIDKITIEIKPSFDLRLIKVEGDDANTTVLRKVIETYFLEKGNNLHLVQRNEKSMNSVILNENYNYNVCINLIDASTRNNKINNLLTLNQNLGNSIFFILANKKDEGIGSDNIFYLECGNKLEYLSHTAAYLNNLKLSKVVKDYCYTQTKSIIPDVTTKVEINNQQWLKNYIVNIGGKGVVLGGELKNGENLVNSFMIKLLEKKLKVQLFTLLTLKYNKSEIQSQLYNIITNELNNFYDINAIEGGFYKNKDYSIHYNGDNFEVIFQNEYLDKGYKLYIVDILKISEEDSKNHKMTPIVIVLNMQKQIRFIELDMEMI